MCVSRPQGTIFQLSLIHHQQHHYRVIRMGMLILNSISILAINNYDSAIKIIIILSSVWLIKEIR